VNKKLFIKVCGMREPSNIKKLVALNLDYIGFIFYPKSKRFIDDSNAEEILKQVPNHIKKVGVFVNEDLENVIRRIKLYGLDLVQLHGEESPEYCMALKESQVEIIKAFGVDNDFDFSVTSPYENACDYFLFDTKSANHGGTGIRFDWSILKSYNHVKPFFLSGGIGSGDQSDIKFLQSLELNLFALDLNSKFEISPGMKDIGLLSEFLDSIV
jgi:phosphoribosylanthranilate isomerase